MKCPIDNTQLAITERQGIEVDYCPQCRGVWLDRGELDKMIDKSESTQPARYYTRSQPEQTYREHGDEHQHKKRRESFLGDLFDF